MGDQFVGEIRLFGGKNAPDGWLLCNGQVLNVLAYPALYRVIGNTYGGDGETTFALPDARGRIPLHQGQGIGGAPHRLGDSFGEETVTLLTMHLPEHSHQAYVSSAAGTPNSPSDAVWALSTRSQYSAGTPGDAMAPSSLSVAGRGMPHDNMMPYLPVSFMIASEGELP